MNHGATCSMKEFKWFFPCAPTDPSEIKVGQTYGLTQKDTNDALEVFVYHSGRNMIFVVAPYSGIYLPKQFYENYDLIRTNQINIISLRNDMNLRFLNIFAENITVDIDETKEYTVFDSIEYAIIQKEGNLKI